MKEKEGVRRRVTGFAFGLGKAGLARGREAAELDGKANALWQAELATGREAAELEGQPFFSSLHA